MPKIRKKAWRWPVDLLEMKDELACFALVIKENQQT